MRVGILASLLNTGPTYRSAGVSTYVRHLLQYLPAVSPGHEYVAFVPRDAAMIAGVTWVSSPVSLASPVARVAWEQTGFVWQSARSRPDVIHGAVNTLPVVLTRPAVVTVHDLAFLRHPERFRRSRVAYLRTATALSVKRATRVIAVSQSTARDLQELLSIPPEKTTVVYPGVDPAFRPLGAEAGEIFRRERFAGRPYILYVGTLEPRKNVDQLIRAFGEMCRLSALPHVLALVGAPGWMYDGLFRLVAEIGLEDRVHFAGHVSSDELPLWYNGADLFAYPSAYEGFGLPVLEAMSCGVPTVTSSSSSLAELAGSACLTVDPSSQEDLQVAMTSVLENRQVAASLREAGLRRAAAFSWERTARETVEVYAHVCGGHP